MNKKKYIPPKWGYNISTAPPAFWQVRLTQQSRKIGRQTQMAQLLLHKSKRRNLATYQPRLQEPSSGMPGTGENRSSSIKVSTRYT